MRSMSGVCWSWRRIAGEHFGIERFGIQGFGIQAEPHEVYDRSHLHLAHQVLAMNFDCARTDRELGCDVLGIRTRDEQLDHLDLARGQAIDQAAHAIAFHSASPRGDSPCDTDPHRLQHRLSSKRLHQKLRRTRPERGHDGIDIGMPAHQKNGRGDVTLGEPLAQAVPAVLDQPHVEQDACRLGGGLRIQELFFRFEAGHPIPGVPQRSLQHGEERQVVLDYRDERRFRSRQTGATSGLVSRRSHSIKLSFEVAYLIRRIPTSRWASSLQARLTESCPRVLPAAAQNARHAVRPLLFSALCLVAILFASPASADAREDKNIANWLARATESREAGDRDTAVRALIRVLEAQPIHPIAHQRLLEISGPAGKRELLDPEAKIRRAMAHPYDSAALLQGAVALIGAARLEEAIQMLERAVWLADRDPASALDAALVLRKIAPGWQTRRIVPVHVHADAAVRSTEGWRFAVRAWWLSASNSLDGTLRTRFVPILIDAFDPREGVDDLNAIHAEFLEKVKPPEEGIAALMTGRPGPTGPGAHESGVAELLGRTLVVRIVPGANEERVLAHEILHLYGAMHMPDEVDSLMNRSAPSPKLDLVTAKIVRSLVERTFGPGGIEHNVLPHVDLRQTTDAYVDALDTVLAFSDSGDADVRKSFTVSRTETARNEPHVSSLDPHFADVARIVSVLMLADSRRSDALRLLDLAVDLYGASDSEKSVQTARMADLLRRDGARSKLANADAGR